MTGKFIIGSLLLATLSFSYASAEQPSWSLTMEGLRGAMSFAKDQSAGTLELRHTDEKRRSLWTRYQRARKFERNADAFGLGAAIPIPLPRSAFSLEILGAPNQLILPEVTIDSSLIHDPCGWLETIFRYRLAHYPASNVHLFSPTLIWMPSERWQISTAYYWTLTEFFNGGATVPDHSASVKVLMRLHPHFSPWVAYTYSEESFEAGAGQATGEFSANHYLVGATVPLWKSMEFRPSFEYEERNNHQILRTGTAAIAFTW